MRFRGTVYRAHDPRWSFEPLSGEGARLHGGRFNTPGTPALYLSLDVETALAEANQGFSRKIDPTLIVAYDVDCEPVADLTSAAFLQSNNIDAGDIACPWLRYKLAGLHAPSWALAEALRSQGFAGLKVASQLAGASANNVNLVLWHWSDRRPAKVVAHDPDKRLPKDQSSWR